MHRASRRQGIGRLAIGPEQEFGVLALGSDFHCCPARRDPDHAGMLAEPLDLIGARRTLLVQPVGGYQLVPEQERRLRPNEDVADPAPVATAPFRATP